MLILPKATSVKNAMWDEKYAPNHYVYGTKPNTFLAQNFTEIKPGKVLCLADGEGRNSVFLAKQGYTVTAVDSSINGINKARQLAKENNVGVDYIHTDLAEFDLGINQWDGIVSIFCHLPVAIREPLHNNVVTALTETGVFLLEAYTPKQLTFGTGGPPVAELTMTIESLSRELKNLRFTHLQALDREVVEGTLHTGKGAVVQAIAMPV